LSGAMLIVLSKITFKSIIQKLKSVKNYYRN
jgi:hypothetical protein